MLPFFITPSAVVPDAEFSAVPVSGSAPLRVVFTDLSTETPTSWLWEKNDGQGWRNFDGTPTVQNPTEYFGPGSWSIRLTATNAIGSNSDTVANYIVSLASVNTNPTDGLPLGLLIDNRNDYQGWRTQDLLGSRYYLAVGEDREVG